ncbi:MAG: carboxymuconolactone decarboxylase family protein [Candidatus Rokubacteria bacterium]|nr:carboxymuconolactone decarboxylase family protein [Candidatus Rokubacteria bacterium]
MAAGKLQGYADDRVWYELSFTIGLTHGLNTLADSLRLTPEFSGEAGRAPLLPLVDALTVGPEVKRILDEAQAFFAMEWPPAVFLAMAHDPGYLADYWLALKATFADGALDRLTKEVMAFAVSVTAKSDYGTDFHLREVRRLGASERAVIEALEVTQLFNGFTKIADTLRLTPDFTA